jgi:hypothetical protein
MEGLDLAVGSDLKTQAFTILRPVRQAPRLARGLELVETAQGYGWHGHKDTKNANRREYFPADNADEADMRRLIKNSAAWAAEFFCNSFLPAKSHPLSLSCFQDCHHFENETG